MMVINKVMKSVNSKLLISQITAYAEELMTTAGINWADESERVTVATMLEEYLAELNETDGSVEQYKVISDRRNNTVANSLRGLYNLHLIFRQKNCFNTTKILYTINVGPNIDLNDTPDFTI
jgi:hypothetical protein